MDQETKTAFIPVIPLVSTTDTHKELRRVFRNAVQQALSLQVCAMAIAKYKTNGKALGHKVLDDGKAVEELIEAAPDHLRKVLEMDSLSLYEKTRGLNDALRSRFHMDRDGKLNGELSQRYLLKHSSEPKA